MGMKQILVMMAAVVLVGCSKDTPETSQAAEAEPQVASKPTSEPTPVSPADEKLIADPIVEKAVLLSLEKPEGELTEADLEKVTVLALDFTKITDAGLKEVVKLQKLIELSLHSTKITDEGLNEVAKLKQLTYLSLSYTEITDASLKDVAKLRNLDALNLSRTQITDEGLKELAKLQNLKGLSLEDSKVTDAGVAELKKALPNCEITGP